IELGRVLKAAQRQPQAVVELVAVGLAVVPQVVEPLADAGQLLDRIEVADRDVPAVALALAIVGHPQGQLTSLLARADLLLEQTLAGGRALVDRRAELEHEGLVGQRLVELVAQLDPQHGLGSGEPDLVLLGGWQRDLLGLGLGDVDLVAGIDQVGVGSRLAKLGVVRVIVDGSPVGEAVLLRDPIEAVPRYDDVDHGPAAVYCGRCRTRADHRTSRRRWACAHARAAARRCCGRPSIWSTPARRCGSASARWSGRWPTT